MCVLKSEGVRVSEGDPAMTVSRVSVGAEWDGGWDGLPVCGVWMGVRDKIESSRVAQVNE